jgi:hypothetical protein
LLHVSIFGKAIVRVLREYTMKVSF